MDSTNRSSCKVGRLRKRRFHSQPSRKGLMKFPATLHELEANGYKPQGKDHCLGKTCSALIHWFKTPAGKNMPLSQRAGEPGLILEPHFLSCPNASDFRKEKSA